VARFLRAATVAALIISTLLFAAPASAAYVTITRVAADSYRLRADWSDDALAAKLRTAADGRAAPTLATLMSDLDHRTGACDPAQRSALPPANVSAYFCWDAVDSVTKKWTPQGITGSYDAALSGVFEGQTFTAVSWYGDQGVRVSFVNAARTAYRSVLLVDPTSATDFAPIHAHAAGISLAGRYLYVTDMRVGLRVFDLDRLMTVSTGRDAVGHVGAAWYAYGYRYVLPQVALYTNSGAALEYSSLALDRSTVPDSLVVSEYDRARGALVVSYPVDHDSRRLAASSGTAYGPGTAKGTVTARAAVRLPVTNVQGAATYGGVYYLGTSSGTGHAGSWAGTAGGSPRRTTWAVGGEDLYTQGTTLWSLTEHAYCNWSGASCGQNPSGRRLDMRTVFAMPMSALR
jgi:hypothetical protein